MRKWLQLQLQKVSTAATFKQIKTPHAATEVTSTPACKCPSNDI